MNCQSDNKESDDEHEEEKIKSKLKLIHNEDIQKKKEEKN